MHTHIQTERRTCIHTGRHAYKTVISEKKLKIGYGPGQIVVLNNE